MMGKLAAEGDSYFFFVGSPSVVADKHDEVTLPAGTGKKDWDRLAAVVVAVASTLPHCTYLIVRGSLADDDHKSTNQQELSTAVCSPLRVVDTVVPIARPCTKPSMRLCRQVLRRASG